MIYAVLYVGAIIALIAFLHHLTPADDTDDPMELWMQDWQDDE